MGGIESILKSIDQDSSSSGRIVNWVSRSKISENSSRSQQMLIVRALTRFRWSKST